MIRQILPIALVGLSACQGPWGGIEKLSEQTLVSGADAAAAVAEADGTDQISSAEDLAAQVAVSDVKEDRPKGFLASLKKLTASAPDETQNENVTLAGLVEGRGDVLGDPELPASTEKPENSETLRMPRLLGLLRGDTMGKVADVSQPNAPLPKTKGPETDVVAGTLMAFGNVGRICDLKKSDMGQKVTQYPERGGKYRIFDTAPEGTHARTMHITGFADGCARQFTGAMAMFGDVEMHEAIRYGTAADIQPLSEVGRAYDRVKARVCKVGKSKPCGDRISALKRTTVFLSVYETFGTGGRWSNILLHDGNIEGMDIAAKSDQ